MPGPFLYSTNVFLKHFINTRYLRGVHYVWCSESFDAQVRDSHTPASMLPPSSNPAEIYRDLAAAVQKKDKHNTKLKEQRASLAALAVDLATRGVISDQDKEDIQFFVDTADFGIWRPVLYIISRVAVESRLEPVPARLSAGYGPEFIIRDLQPGEFEIIEVLT